MLTKEQEETQLNAEENCKKVDIPLKSPIKHPLENRWTLWFHKPEISAPQDRDRAWLRSLFKVASFDTVEDFWALYTHVKPASYLLSGCDYSLFKDGIQPMWEDKKNEFGGKWHLEYVKDLSNKDLNYTWREILMSLIGEAFENVNDEICGAVINIRNKGHRISVWTTDARRHDNMIQIGRKLKEVLQISNKCQIKFEPHSEKGTKYDLGINKKLYC